MLGFRWIVSGELAGSPQPGLYGDWEDDITYLKKRGIGFVMSLTEEPLIQQELTDEGFGFYHLPIRDMDAPMPRNAHEALNVLIAKIDAGHKVLIHCKGGVGRTGMIGACYLVTKGYTPQEAIQKVRSVHNAYIQTRNQELFVSNFQLYIDSVEGE